MRSLDRIETELDTESVPYLRDLELAGVPVVPSAVVLEIAGATAAIAEQGEAMVQVRLPEPVVHTERDEVELVADLHQNSSGAYGVRIHRADWARTVHVQALFAPGSSAEKTGDPIPLADIRRRCVRPVSRAEFYADLAALGISCGPAIGCVDTAWRGNQEMLGSISSAVSEVDAELYRLHPVMLEAALQPAFALLTPWEGGGWYLGGIDRFEIHREGASVAWTHVVRTDTSRDFPTFHIGLLDADGYVVAELTGARMRTFRAGDLRPPRLAPPSGAEVREMADGERRETVRAGLHRWLAQVMRVDSDELDTNRELRSYGIDSFMGMELKALLQRHWEIDIPVPLLFDGRTVETLTDDVIQRFTAGHTKAIRRREHGEISRLSRGQEALWSIHRFAAESGAYHVATALRVLSPLNTDALEEAWRAVVARHGLLGATFGEDERGPYYRPGSAVDFACVDAPAELERVLAEEADRPFVLEDSVPVRLRVYRRADGESVLLICAHHIVVDMWSCVVLLEELALEYGGGTEPARPAVEYADFVDWQRDLLASPDGDRLWEYWRDRLSGELPVLALPADRPRPAVQTFRGASRVFGLGRELTERLKDLGVRCGVTPFVVLLSAYQLLLHRETGQDRVVVGSPISGRGRSELERTVGYFVNPVPLIADFASAMSFEDVLEQVREVVLGAFEHEDFPMAEMVERLAPERDSSYSPLYQTMFVMQRSQAFDSEGLASLAVGAGDRLRADAIELHSLVVEPVTVPRHWSMFDLTWMVAESDDGFLVSVDYNTDLFDESTVERFLEHFRVLLDGVAGAPRQHVERVPLLAPAERDLIVREWNDTAVDFGAAAAGRVHEGVWAAGARHPDSVAVIAHDGQLSYRELLARASRIGWWLRERGARPNELVGVCLPKCTDQVAAVLGVVASGAAYLPLDPALPQARLAELIELGQVGQVLTHSGIEMPPGVTRLDLDVDELAEFSAEMPDVVQAPTDLAYVIFTSGSTGVPKGVMIDHLGVLNTVVDINRRFEVTPGDRVLGLASLSFDLSVYDIFGPLAVGAALVLPAPDGVKDPSHWVRLVHRHGITVWDSVPMLLQLLVEAPEANAQTLASLRVGLLSGDWIPVSLPEKVWALNPGMKIYSGGGATEASIWSISYPITHVDPSWMSIPYGRPLSNQRFYILNSAQEPCPVGVAGELCIGGIGVARGYWGDEERTNASFLPDPFSDDPRALLYRTGDLGRWRADGVIEFLGRVDHQVKIRGFRVELGEIDSVLSAHPSVDESVTVVHDGRLASYVVAGTAVPAELRDWVRSRLPEYMVPAGVTLLDRLPLSANGKVDRSSLPEPVWQSDDEFVEARSDTERVLAGIWADVLGVERVGVRDNFFALGGDSILSIQMVSRAAQHGIHLTPAQVFREQTVARLAEVAGAGPVVVAEQGPVVGPVELGPVQRWFFGLDLADRNHWNQSVVLESSVELDPGRVAQALETVLGHHDVLRSVFTREDGRWHQEQLAEAVAPVVDGDPNLGLDLAHGPLLQAAIDGTKLVLACHHLVIDAVSWRFVLEDFERAYLGLGEPPAKTTSFAEWTSRLADYDATEQVEYWREVLSTVSPLPTDRTGDDRHAGAVTRRVQLPASAVLDAGRRLKARPDELVLTACARALTDWTGREGVTVDVEAHGREALFDDIDLSRTAGWFTTIRPVHLPVGGTDEIGALRAVKRSLRSAPDQGIGYGVLRHTTDLLPVAPPVPVLFNYLGQIDQSGEAFTLRYDVAANDAGYAPENRRHHTVEINAGLHRDQLVIDFTYAAERHDAATVDALLDGVRRHLATLAGSTRTASIPEDFPLTGVTEAELAGITAEHGSIDDLYPATPMQQGLLFHTLAAPESGVYIEQIRLRLSGELQVPALCEAWQRTVRRHPALRTALAWADLDTPYQVVHTEVTAPIVLEERDDLGELLREDRTAGFSLAEAPLMRVRLVRTDDRTWELVWSHHHVVLDGWSAALVLEDFFAVYRALSAGEEPPPATAPSYRDYVAWLEAQDFDAAEAYWRTHLAGFTEPTRLGIEQVVAATDRRPEAAESLVELPAELSDRAREFARAHGLTLNTVLMGAWSLLLSRYSGQRDLVFGVTSAGRPAEVPDVERMIGLFINTLPARVGVPAEQRVAEWLHDLQRVETERRRHENTPLTKVHEWSDVAGGTSLFDHIFVVENYLLDESVFQVDDRLRVSDYQSYEQTNYLLALVVEPLDRLTLRTRHDPDRLTGDTVERLLGHFEVLLDGVISAPDRAVGEVPLLGAAERDVVVRAWNDTDEDFGAAAAGCVHEGVWSAGRAFPDSAAVIAHDGQLSYRELLARASRIGWWLRERGARPNELVGVCLPKCADQVAAVLGVVASGAAYLPLDPGLPLARLAELVELGQVTKVLTHSGIEMPPGVTRLDLDVEDLASYSAEMPEVVQSPTDLAYVIFTSGSTGVPKGVMIDHLGVLNTVVDINRRFDVVPEDRVLGLASLSFDLSVYDIFGPLSVGAALVLPAPDGVKDPSHWVELVARHGITVWDSVPMLLQLLVEAPEANAQTLASLRVGLLSGDWIPVSLPEKVWALNPGMKIYSGGGATEASIWSISYPITHVDPSWTSIPYGRPLSNQRFYILNEQQQVCPVGVAGELCIGGIGVARGYWGDEERTNASFLPDPFSDDPRALLYRTGDLGRWRADGVIEFLGRVDHQVKIRGFRVELGEIDSVLSAHPSVDESVTVVHDGRLASYVVAEQANVSALREWVRERLPEYMVPSGITVLDRLPLSANGKVDRSALPEPVWQSDGEFVEPRSERERALAAVWADVLGVERVGIHDNFFTLGGDSILSIQMVSKAAQHGIHLTPAQVFREQTVARLVEAVGEHSAIRRRERPPGAVSRLSRGQEALWSIYRFADESGAYHVATAMRVLSPLDTEQLRRGWQAVVSRHSLLGAVFGEDENGPYYRIDPRATADFEVVDARDVADFDGLVADEADRPFALDGGAPVRLRVFERADGESVLLICAHHIVVDLWSCVVLLEELALEYRSEATMPPPAVEYADFVDWQRELLAGPDGERLWDYWRARLDGDLPVLALPADRPRPAVQSFRGANRVFNVGAEISGGLKELGTRLGVTPFVVLLSAYQLFLHRETGQNRIVVGSPTAGRGQPEIDNVVGYFINPLPMVTDFTPGMSFADTLRQVQEVVLGAFEHEDFPMAEMVERLAPERDSSYSPLYQTMFVMQRAQAFDNEGLAPLAVGAGNRLQVGDGEAIQLHSMVVEPATVRRRWSMFDLTWMVAEAEDGFLVSVDYNTDLFDESTVERFLEHFRVLLDGVLAAPEKPVAEVPLLTEAERAQLVDEWNDTAVDFGDEAAGCLHEGVWAAGARYPTATAVIAHDGQLSYRDLLARASRIGWRLREQGAQPNELVGICLPKCADQVAAVLGVVASGAAYLPLDPALPQARLAELIELGQVRRVLTHSDIELPEVDRLDLDVEDLASYSAEMPEVVQSPTDLAYVIFTSGSTGVPKGVMIDHLGVLNTVVDINRRFDVVPEDRVLGLASLSFDLSVYDIFGPLSVGAALVLPAPDGVKDPSHWVRLIDRHEVTVWDSVPMLLQLLVEAPEANSATLTSLRVGLLSGDWIPLSLPEKVWAVKPEMLLYSGGGATEASIWSISYPITHVDPSWTSIPYGRPLANQRFYILNESQQLCPVGVAGELCIGGIGVARGYWGDETRTNASFLPDPFSDDPRALLYRTGDLGRWRADGVIEFLGRVDHQVKIRGFRVELGEIDSVLSAHPSVDESVTVVLDGRLASYVVADEVTELREWVRQRLPEYMVPAGITPLDRLPLSANGKVDRSALPEPVWQAADEFVEARSEQERVLAGIWAEVLGLDEVGVLDNFFALGGDSILSIQMVSRAAQHGIHLTPAQVFREQTVARLVEVAGEGPVVVAEQGPVVGPVELGPVQRWFFGLELENQDHWNQGVVLDSGIELDPDLVGEALGKVLAHHDVLRSRFAREGVDWAQEQLEADEVPVELVDGTGRDPDVVLVEAVRAAHAGLDIENGPLLRAVVVDLDGTQRLVLACHHLVIDAVSWRFLVEDFERAYTGQGELPPKTTSFAEWTARLREHDVSDQAEYWREVAGTITPLPVDRAGQDVQASAVTRRLVLPADTTTALVESARRVKARTDELVLTACAQGLADWSGRAGITIDVEGHGREPLFDDVDLSRTAGWFTVIRPVHLPVGGAEAADAVRVVKQALREAPDGGLGYGLLREELELPDAPVLFNYLGQVDPSATGDSVFRLQLDNPAWAGAAQAPENTRHHTLEINAGIHRTELVLDLTYSTERHTDTTAGELLDGIRRRLDVLAGHESADAAGTAHTSDFPLAGLSQQALEDLMAKMEGNAGA